MLVSAYACTVVVWIAGRRVLPMPPLDHPGRLTQWWLALGPVTALFGVGRAVLLLSSGLLSLVLTAALTLAAVSRAGGAGSATARRAAGWYRRRGRSHLLLWALGLSVSGAAVAGCATATAVPGASGSSGAGGAGGPHPAPLLIGPGYAALPPARAAPPSAPVRTPATRPRGPLTARPAPPTSPTAPPVTRTAAAPAEAPRLSAAAPAPAPGAPEALVALAGAPAAGGGGGPSTWTVRPGDDFWSIAERVVGSQGAGAGAAGAPGAVARYWAAVVVANRDRLPVPGHPDLLFPGDVVVLPPLPGPGA